MGKSWRLHENFVDSSSIRASLITSSLVFTGGEARSQAEVGFQAAGQAEERHRPGVSGGLCPLRHGEEARHVCPVQPRSKGKDEEDRLSKTSGQGD